MINYNSAVDLRAFLDQEGLGMQKKFGQNFLINPQIRQTLIAALDVNSKNEVWEIGPGLGAMTAMLLEKGLTVKAFEIDNGFIRVLKKLFGANSNFSLVEGDVMKTWETHFNNNTCKLSDETLKKSPLLLGNLPYNIAAALLADFIEKGCIFSRMVVTVQKEVALRMAASAGSADYSSFSVLCASAYKVKPLITIRRESFYPRPNVDSMGVLLESHDAVFHEQNGSIPVVFYTLVRSLFAARRKTIKNNLLTFFSSRIGKNSREAMKTQDLCSAILQENGINSNERAENLGFEVFLSLAKTIDNMRLFK